MKYFVDNKEIKNVNYISEGMESTVYGDFKNVYKIYRDYSYKQRLNLDMVIKMSEIDTKRIMLPRKIIYDVNGDFKGYTMRELLPFNKEIIKKESLIKLKEELKIIKEDIDNLSRNNIEIDDLIDDNFIYSNGFYLVDPGSYQILEGMKKENIENSNVRSMNEFIINTLLKYNKLTKKEKDIILSYFKNDFDSDIYMVNQFYMILK